MYDQRSDRAHGTPPGARRDLARWPYGYVEALDLLQKMIRTAGANMFLIRVAREAQIGYPPDQTQMLEHPVSVACRAGIPARREINLPNHEYSYSDPPPQRPVTLIYHLFEFYKKFYRLRTKISKQDRHGIYSKLDALILDAIALAIKARFQTGIEKVPTLKDLRTNIEILKRMVRLMQELDIIGLSLYQAFEEELQEISKETNGWIGSFQKNNRLL